MIEIKLALETVEPLVIAWLLVLADVSNLLSRSFA
jgi:hypothetical protein